MKKIPILSFLCFFLLTGSTAQDLIKAPAKDYYAAVDVETYDQFLDNYLRIQFRSFAYEILDLSKEEIIATDPIFMDYIKAKNKLFDRRLSLVNDMKSQAESSTTDTYSKGDFLEAYWENSIQEQNLRKEYFNKLREVIPYAKAFQFFLLEENLQGKAEEDQVSGWLADIPQWNQGRQMYSRTLARYNRWMHNLDGGVNVTHDYTYEGLEKLTQTIEAIVIVNHLDIDRLYQRTDKIMALGNSLQSAENVDQHALIARKAFVEVAKLVEDITQHPGLKLNEHAAKLLRKSAEQIDPEILYIEQAGYTYNFFQEAQQLLNDMSM